MFFLHKKTLPPFTEVFQAEKNLRFAKGYPTPEIYICISRNCFYVAYMLSGDMWRIQGGGADVEGWGALGPGDEGEWGILVIMVMSVILWHEKTKIQKIIVCGNFDVFFCLNYHTQQH